MCIQQLVELQRGYPKIKALAADVLVIGVDPAKAWDRTVKKYKLTLKILADEDRTVSRAYGALGLPSTMHPDRPGHTFLIVDRDGVIRWKKDMADMDLVATSIILEQLQRFQTKRE